MSTHQKFTRRSLLALGTLLPFAHGAFAQSGGKACSLTPAQTTGPFFPLFTQIDTDVDLTRLTGHGASARGTVIRVEGRVLDVACAPIAGVLVDLWQANAAGRYMHPADRNPAPLDPNFQGWGQAVTDEAGRFAFRTIKPAAYPLEWLGDKPNPDAGYRTPHIHFRFTKAGFRELATQLYFPGEALNEKDGVLNRVPRAEWSKVIGRPAAGAAGAPTSFWFEATIAKA